MVTAITRQDPATAAYTNASSVTWDVRFDHSMSTVNANDFTVSTVSGSATGSVAGVTKVGPTWYRVTANVSGTGSVRLNAVTGGSGRDVASQALASTYTGGEVYMIDRDAPSVTISAPSATMTKNSSITYTITYADGGSGISAITLATGNITLNRTNTANGVSPIGAKSSRRPLTIRFI